MVRWLPIGVERTACMPAERGSVHAPGRGSAQCSAAADRGAWPKALRRWLGIGFLTLVGGLIALHARDIDWPAVGNALRAYRWPTLLGAALLGAFSHALYSTYDLLGRRLTQHHLSRRATMAVAFVSYAFNLNLGSLVGGVAMRLRLYTRLGLKPAVVMRVLGLSVMTNWLGYAVLAGACLVWMPLPVPDTWRLGGGALRALGALLLGAAVFYPLACAKARRRRWQWRNQQLTLPGWRVAVLQLVLSACNWLLIAGTVFALLGGRVDFGTLLGALLVAAVAGAVSHVPAGLGVLEAVFLALLSPRVPPNELLAALLAYRGLYYLVPLGLALPIHLAIERRSRTR
jgi:uncharacterized membrane protein YbhN (UPF0104 family)